MKKPFFSRPQRSLMNGRARRDAGMQRVMDNNPLFKKQFRQYVTKLPSGWLGQCEDIRLIWCGVQPHSEKAWGANWGACIKRGLLEETPHQAQMKAKKSNARKTHLFRRTDLEQPPRDFIDPHVGFFKKP